LKKIKRINQVLWSGS